MPSWGNTDSVADKPHFSKERQVRQSTIPLTTANSTSAGGTTIVFTGVGALTAANLGVVAGMSAFSPSANVSSSGEPEFFIANNRVASVTGNVVVMTSAVSGIVAAGQTVEFSAPIPYANGEEANTYNQDTILVTVSRLANAAVNVNHSHAGWTHVYKTTNGSDGAVRYRSETLVATANAVASNTASGNTSQAQIYTGI